jgi:uncharacterized protein YbaR (Trm112 family)
MASERTATGPGGSRPLDLITASGVVCPVCHGALAVIPQGGVGCCGCGRVYPVRDGLPVLIASEAALR